MDLKTYAEEQKKLARQVKIPSNNTLNLQKGDLIFTFDVQYESGFGYVAVDIQEWQGNHLKTFLRRYKVVETYQAGYFAFSEGPLLLQAYKELTTAEKLDPSLLIVDGHGTAHPRQFGLACWLGIQTQVSTIGVAKAPLIDRDYDLDEGAGSRTAVIQNGKVVGYVLRTQTGIKPIFVSSGHLISQEQAVEIVYALRGEHRIIEPIRRADAAARAFARDKQQS